MMDEEVLLEARKKQANIFGIFALKKECQSMLLLKYRGWRGSTAEAS